MALGSTCAMAAQIDRDSIVATHNKLRIEVGVGQLSYSPELEVSSEAWADHLKQTNHCQIRYSVPEGRYGENLFWASALSWSDDRRVLQLETLPGI